VRSSSVASSSFLSDRSLPYCCTGETAEAISEFESPTPVCDWGTAQKTPCENSAFIGPGVGGEGEKKRRARKRQRRE